MSLTLHAFQWYKGKMADLGTLGGSESDANCVNDSGTIVGSSVVSRLDKSGRPATHACMWIGGHIVDIGSRFSGDSEAVAINGSGYVVGSYDSATKSGSTLSKPFLYYGGGERHVTLLPSRSNVSYAVAIDKRNRILIRSQLKTGGNLYDLYFAGKLHPINSLYKSTFAALGMNNRDMIAGVTDEPVLVSHGHIQVLFTRRSSKSADGCASAINDQGEVMGDIASNFDQDGVASLWFHKLRYDLNYCIPTSTDWELTEATGINKHGQIIGSGYVANTRHMYLLTPIAIPKPAPLRLSPAFTKDDKPYVGQWGQYTIPGNTRHWREHGRSPDDS